jgi:hypothetical protein
MKNSYDVVILVAALTAAFGLLTLLYDLAVFVHTF